MNKQELIDKAVRDFGGVWRCKHDRLLELKGAYASIKSSRNLETICWNNVCTKQEFERRAIEMGYKIKLIEDNHSIDAKL